MFLKKKELIFLILLFAFSLFFIGSTIKADRETKDQTYKELSLFADAISIIQNQYVDDTMPKGLVYGALKGMLSSLDPYSEFLSQQDYKDLKASTEGRFGGVGMEIAILDGLVTVISPLEDTPAWNAGVKTGDRIIKIDDKITKDYTINEAVRALRGIPGTEVKITAWRQGESELLEFNLVRAMIKIEDLRDMRIIEPGIGYARLVEFSEQTPRDLSNALANLQKQGMRAFVLDVRNNPGGLLDVAARVAEIFLDKGAIIVSTKGRIESQDLMFYSKRDSKYKDILMVVLVNEGSASGSEILAGALQDHGRAIIVGKKTFGKGSVQSIIPLSDGSAVKLTTSKYFTPLGRTIQGEGIEPDINVEYINLAGLQQQKVNLPEQISETFGIEDGTDLFIQRYRVDNQLIRAVDVLKGLVVYRDSQQ